MRADLRLAGHGGCPAGYPSGKLPRGAYEALLTEALAERLGADDGDATLDKLDKGEAAERLAAHLREVVQAALAAVPAKDRPASQLALSNSTAYVGSSNLSHAALVDGIEWNVRLAGKSAPSVFGKLRAAFDSLWSDESFEPYEPERDGERFERAVSATRTGTAATGVSGLYVRPWPDQREILEALYAECEAGDFSAGELRLLP